MDNVDKAFARLSEAVQSLPPAEYKSYEAKFQPVIFAVAECGIPVSLN